MDFKNLKVRAFKARMTLSTLAIFLVSMWSLSYYAAASLRQEIVQMSGHQQMFVVTLLADQINSELNDRLQLLKEVAREVEPAMFAKTATLQAFLQDHQVLLHAFNGGVFITGSDGTAIGDLPLSAGRMGINYIDRTPVSIPLRDDVAMIGQPDMGKKLGAPIFSISAPIQDEKGKVLGVLVGTINLGLPNFLDKLMHRTDGETSDYLLVARDSQRFVAATEKRGALQRAGVTLGSRRHLDGYEGSDVSENSLGVEVLVSGKIVPVANWYLTASLPTAEAFAPVRQMQRDMLWATTVLSLLACTLTWWMLRRQLFPVLSTIEQLALRADEATPLAPLPVPQRTEVAELVNGVNRVIGAIHRRELELSGAGTFHPAIMDAVAAEVVVLDCQGAIIAVNQPWLNFAAKNAPVQGSLTPNTGIGTNYLAICKAAIGSSDGGYALQALEGVQSVLDRRLLRFAMDYPCHSPDKERWFTMLVTALDLSDGRAVVTHLNITARKKAELKEREGHQALHAIVETTLDGFLLVDVAGKVHDANSQYCRVSGYSREELLGMPVHKLNAVLTEAQAFGFIERVIAQGHHQFETVHRRKDGTHWNVEVSLSYRHIAGGQLLAFLRDITGRKQAEAQLLKDKADAELANKAKSNFLAAVSHDLRQPLAAITLYVDRLDPKAPDNLADLIPRLKGCTDHLDGLFNDLLDLSKLQAGAVRPTLTTIPMADLLHAIESVHKAHAMQKGLRLRVRPSTWTVGTDGTLMLRLLGNLVANAVQYTHHGGVLVACRQHGQKHWLEVYDTGIGIAEGQIAGAFEEFKQLNRSGGSGLGLYIVAKSAELLGLQIRVRSVVGRGSMFAIELPIAAPMLPNHRSNALPGGGRLRIAWVEDNKETLQAMSLTLEKMGHEVIPAASGMEIIARLDGRAPDLFIADYNLAAGQTGLDASLDAKAIFGEALPTLIIITADTDKARLRRMALEGIGVLRKPVQSAALRAAIAQVTGQGGGIKK